MIGVHTVTNRPDEVRFPLGKVSRKGFIFGEVMAKYVVTIAKTAEVEVEAENREAAERIARDQEADGCLGFDMEVAVRPVVLGEHTINHWVRVLEDEHNVSVYGSDGHPGRFGFTGCDADDFESLEEAVEAALRQYGLLETAFA